MAIGVTVDSTIERPPDDVFATVADLDAWPRWLVASGIRAVRRERAGEPVEGERLVVEQDAAGRAATFDAEVTAYEPGHRIALRGRDREGVRIDMEAVVVNIGYADGYFRGFSNRGTASAGDTNLPLLGRVSMDLLIFDANGSGIGEGDWVEIVYDLPHAAALSDMSQYELLTGLGSRFERIWR